ncbi:MAG: L-aspartate oxidase [Candidatus Omnitrophica bacterium]|nr:L-aspartate oxidase [Candidatus Omnitrophota bacterium]
MTGFRSNFVIIGSGVAGLKTALEAAELGDVQLITKKEDFESNTNYAQGGIATVLDPNDTFDSHILDTHEAGAGLCHRDSVDLIVTHGPDAIKELIEIGVEFTREQDGRLELGREGGHSARRIVHAQDLTGREVEKALLQNVRDHPRIQVHEFYFAIDLILDENRRCWGVWAWDAHDEKVHQFLAGATILATGGCGLVYRHSTNPSIATGDGVSMAFRAGAKIANMEFIQFHPTALYNPEDKRPYLISEAVRGERAILRAGDGTAFMKNYHKLKDLAPRDIVARAIDNEMKTRGESCCYLDVTHIDQQFFHKRFPFISHICEDHGLNLAKDWIPVVPAAHYMCGGVVTDLKGATSIAGLYSIGETACTGVHGANRLASNSILEALVFSKQSVGESWNKGFPQTDPPAALEKEWVKKPLEELEGVRIVNLRQTLRGLMWDYVGIVRSNSRLEQAKKRLDILKEEIDSIYESGHINTQLLELRNLAQTAELILLCTLQRKESRGLHYNIDYPDLSETPEDSVIRLLPDNDVQVESVPVST